MPRKGFRMAEMKSLDEVITAMEDCAIGEKGCRGCAYEDIHLSAAGIGQSCVEAMMGDALQYLKMYKELADDSAAFAEWKENPPLTWDALKKMVDQPIWLEEREMSDDPFEGNWRLIECVEMWMDVKETERIMVTGSEQESYAVYPNDMGEYWNAYRKERTREDDHADEA